MSDDAKSEAAKYRAAHRFLDVLVGAGDDLTTSGVNDRGIHTAMGAFNASDLVTAWQDDEGNVHVDTTSIVHGALELLNFQLALLARATGVAPSDLVPLIREHLHEMQPPDNLAPLD